MHVRVFALSFQVLALASCRVVSLGASVSLRPHCGALHTGNVGTEGPVLSGTHVRLEPLDQCHVDGLAAAAADDRSLYQWSPVPLGKTEATSYVDTAIAWRDAGTAVPFAIVRVQDGSIVGSTRFFNLERWACPPSHARYGRQAPDACEIGYTWLTSSAVRTAAK